MAEDLATLCAMGHCSRKLDGQGGPGPAALKPIRLSTMFSSAEKCLKTFIYVTITVLSHHL